MNSQFSCTSLRHSWLEFYISHFHHHCHFCIHFTSHHNALFWLLNSLLFLSSHNSAVLVGVIVRTELWPSESESFGLIMSFWQSILVLLLFRFWLAALILIESPLLVFACLDVIGIFCKHSKQLSISKYAISSKGKIEWGVIMLSHILGGRHSSGRRWSHSVQSRWSLENVSRRAEIAMVDGAYRIQSGSEMMIQREWEDKEKERIRWEKRRSRRGWMRVSMSYKRREEEWNRKKE